MDGHAIASAALVLVSEDLNNIRAKKNKRQASKPKEIATHSIQTLLGIPDMAVLTKQL